MGSSENMVGSIVWVRRRNGSWWPGKILGPNELSASHLMSPRSGTPVKLLGREDASVDWYNLEKSKRVKAFRCGEFDDCIERAESSLGLPSKKREKYARREDAILHALELEKQNLVKKHSKLALTNFMRENSSDSGRRGFATSSLALENGNEKPWNHELYQLDEKVDVSTITVRNNTPLHEHKPQDRTYPHIQGQNNIDSHQMKGLQGFGLRAIHVNRTTHSSAGFDDLNRMEIGHLCGVPTNDPCFESSSDSDPWKEIRKGKRSLEGFVEASLQQHADYSLQHDFDFLSMYGKREGEEGGCQFGYFSAEPPRVFDSLSVPQEQVKMPTSRLDMANCHRGTFAEETASGSSEETESDSSASTHALEPHVEAGMFSDVETHIKAQARKTDSSGMREGDESTINDESHEVSVHDMSQFYLPGPNSSGFGVPKWLLKRKRNVRNFPRKPTSRFSHRQYLEETGGSLNHDNGYTENDVDFMVGDFIQTGFIPSQAAAKGPNFTPQNIIDWEELAWGRQSTLVGLNARDLLIDVDLKVQANYQGENVPWVSLTSRLNGKAIVGHPIQIEAVEDGSTDILVSSSELNYDTDGTLPSWRAGNFWHLSSRLDGGENAENRYFHQSGKGRYKNSSSTVKKTHTHLPNPIQRMKKKMNPSSFRFDHKSKKRRKEKNTNYLIDGAIKSVDASPSAVACVPVKLVFSRLLEAIGRAHSGPAKRVVSMNRRNHSLGTL